MKLEQIINFFRDKKGINIIYIVLIIGIFLLSFDVFFPKSETKTKENTQTQQKAEYEKELEERLEETLSKIKGAGRVKVLINLKDEGEIVTLSNIKEKTSGREGERVNDVEKSVAILKIDGNESPLVIRNEKPRVKGVIVIAEGASNAYIKEELTKAVITFLDVPAHNVAVFQGEKNK
ncbi:MAG: hypothetical protein GX196_04025 [Clostridiaceae bacterium]|nr:hypothetical protein [Clostridiaceae bacterium]